MCCVSSLFAQGCRTSPITPGSSPERNGLLVVAAPGRHLTGRGISLRGRAGRTCRLSNATNTSNRTRSEPNPHLFPVLHPSTLPPAIRHQLRDRAVHPPQARPLYPRPLPPRFKESVDLTLVFVLAVLGKPHAHPAHLWVVLLAAHGVTPTAPTPGTPAPDRRGRRGRLLRRRPQPPPA